VCGINTALNNPQQLITDPLRTGVRSSTKMHPALYLIMEHLKEMTNNIKEKTSTGQKK
jgi:hypothetical protein